jgi:hypothetical protein
MPFRREPFTEDSFDSSQCIICQSHSDEALSEVTDRGRPTLLNFCRVHEWLILADILSDPAGQTVFIHSSCRKRFTRLTTADKSDDSAKYSQKKQLRSNDDTFNWKKSCFLCKDDVILSVISLEQDEQAHCSCILPLCNTVLNEQTVGP